MWLRWKNTAWQPAIASVTETASRRSALTSSALAVSRARASAISRVTARTSRPTASASSTTGWPWVPVAPNTSSFLIVILPSSVDEPDNQHSRLREPLAQMPVIQLTIMQSNQSFWTKPTLLFAVFLLSTLSLTACDSGSDSAAQQSRQDRRARTAPVQRANPLDSDWSSPYHVPPFHQVQPNHLPAALEQAIEKAGQTISEIAAQSAPASFENTVLALEQAEQPVLRIARLWYGLAAVSDDDELDRIEPGLNELLARHRSRLIGSTALFERIEEIRHAIPDRPRSEEHTSELQSRGHLVCRL